MPLESSVWSFLSPSETSIFLVKLKVVLAPFLLFLILVTQSGGSRSLWSFPFTGEFFPLILLFSYNSVFGTWFWVFLLSVAVAMDEIDVETITNQAKKFSWSKGKVNLEVVPIEIKCKLKGSAMEEVKRKWTLHREWAWENYSAYL